MKIKLFLTLSSILGYIYFANPSTSLEEAKFASGTVLIITLSNAETIHENGIGDDWSHFAKIDGQILRKGESKRVVLDGKIELIVESVSIEDDKYPDVGKNQIIITPSNLKKIISKKPLTSNVYVYEDRGPGAGKTATCEFTYELSINHLKP